MEEGMIGEVRMFAGNFAPRSWALCEGQLLAISQNTALFSILGTTYGGDGRTTFALPDLRGRCPIQHGAGPGLTDRQLGEAGGVETINLTEAQLPAHSHDAHARIDVAIGHTQKDKVSTRGDDGFVKGSLERDARPQKINISVNDNGGSQPVSVVQPYLGINFIICLQGIYPSRS